MATKLHNQMTGADLHPNAIDGTTGTELTVASQTTYDGRYQGKTAGNVTVTPTMNGTTTLKVTKQDGTTIVFNVDTTNGRVGIGRSTASAALDIDQPSAGNVFITRNSGNQRFSIAQAGGTDVIGSANSNMQLSCATVVSVAPVTNGTATFQVLKQDGATNVFDVDTTNGRVGVGTTTPNSPLHVTGAIATAITTNPKTGAYTATATDSTITADATAGAVQITLPTAVGIAGRQYAVKRLNSGANNVTVIGTTAQTLDGATTKTLGAQFSALTAQSDGANWQLLSTLGTVS